MESEESPKKTFKLTPESINNAYKKLQQIDKEFYQQTGLKSSLADMLQVDNMAKHKPKEQL